eukprot:GEMP01006637.1.p1 GENE.GEMP01006637.1~~GEMP01006637.1.p1  ORF type:complete len:1130 (+),score=295.79 GEMP01006637.1:147-3536(+)
MSLYPPGRRSNASSREADGRMKVIFGRNPQLVFPPTQRKAMCVPTNLTHELRREHVYGFNGDTRASIHFLSRSLVMFPVAALVVIEDIHHGTQRHFAEHDSDVTCVALTSPSAPGERWCASGQMDPRGPSGPPIYVWSPDTLTVRTTLVSHERAICAVAFSSDSQYLVSFGCDDRCTVMLWDLRNTHAKQTRPMKQYSSGRQATRVIHPCGDGLFVSLGLGHWKHWVYTDDANGPLLSGRRGIFGRCSSVEPTDVCTVETDIGLQLLLCGPTGFVYKACGSSCTSAAKATKEGTALGAICGTNDRNQLAICGALCLIGTSNHVLLVADIVDKQVLKVLHVGHANEAWALACHPTLSLAASGSQGKDIRFWNVGDKRATIGKVMRLEEAVYSVTFSPSGNYLVAGMDKGVLEIFSFPELQPHVKKYLGPMGRRERISEVKYAPNGHFLAAASWDQTVYLLKVIKVRNVRRGRDDLSISLFKNLTGNSSSPLKVLFSADSAFLMSNSKDTQILYWRTNDGQRQPAAATFRDVQWDNWDCLLGWPVIGIWGDPNYDGTDVNSVAVSGSHCVIADDYYKVKLFPFPCPTNDPPCLEYKGHACPVTNVKFTPSGVLLSLGGSDHCIMQWSLAPRVAKESTVQAVEYPWAHFPMNDVDDPTTGLGRPLSRPRRNEEDFGPPEPRGSRGAQRDVRHAPRDSQAPPTPERGDRGREVRQRSAPFVPGQNARAPQPPVEKHERPKTAQQRTAGMHRREDEPPRGDPRRPPGDKQQNRKHEQDPHRSDHILQQLPHGDQWARDAWGDKPANATWHSDAWNNEWRNSSPNDDGEWRQRDSPRYREHDAWGDARWEPPPPPAHKSGAAGGPPTKGLFDGRWWEDGKTLAPQPRGEAIQHPGPVKGHARQSHAQEASMAHAKDRRASAARPTHRKEPAARTVSKSKHREHVPAAVQHEQDDRRGHDYIAGERSCSPQWGWSKDQDWRGSKEQWRSGSPGWDWSGNQDGYGSKGQGRSGSPGRGWSGDQDGYGSKGREWSGTPPMGDRSRDQDWRGRKDQGGISPQDGRHDRGEVMHGWGDVRGDEERVRRKDSGRDDDPRSDAFMLAQKIRREDAITSKMLARSTEYHRNQSFGVANALRWD